MREIWDLFDENGNQIGKTMQKGEVIQNRWEFVKDSMKEYLKGETYESCDC